VSVWVGAYECVLPLVFLLSFKLSFGCLFTTAPTSRQSRWRPETTLQIILDKPHTAEESLRRHRTGSLHTFVENKKQHSLFACIAPRRHIHRPASMIQSPERANIARLSVSHPSPRERPRIIAIHEKGRSIIVALACSSRNS